MRVRTGLLLLLGIVCLVSVLMASAAVLPGFRSPSGNIACLYAPASRDNTGHLLPSHILCSVRQAIYGKRLQTQCMGPTGAGVDWHGWGLRQTGKGQITCSGGILYNPDTDHPRYVTLPYGKGWRKGAFTCFSRVAGVTCKNREGHGLFISRQAWRAW